MPWADNEASGQYWAVRVSGAPEILESVATWLLEFGLGGVQWEDGLTVDTAFADIGWVPQEAPHVTAYFPDDERWPAYEKRVREYVQARNLTVEIDPLASSDWEEGWKAYYQPIALSRGYGIVPAWIEPSPFLAAKTIWLDPGMAFGTGTHATTRSCLDFMIEQGAAKRRVLDLGSGSGILALMAATLGAGHVDAVEPDPVAARALKRNIELNQYASRITVIPGIFQDLPNDAQYDVVLMNLIRELIVPLWPDVAQRVREYALLSGILEDSLSEIESVVRASGFQIAQYRLVEGWATLRVTR